MQQRDLCCIILTIFILGATIQLWLTINWGQGAVQVQAVLDIFQDIFELKFVIAVSTAGSASVEARAGATTSRHR